MPEGKINDPGYYKRLPTEESDRKGHDAKKGISTEYLRYIINTKNVPESR
jgi:hypothetical protein